MSLVRNFIKNFLKKITKLSRPYFSLNENQLIFKINSDTFYKYEIESMEMKTRHDPYVMEAYTLRSKDIYLEYIHTDNDIQWEVLALSTFIELLKVDLNVKKFELIEKFEYKNYNFFTYRINNDFYINIIYLFEVSKEIFIVDLDSKLYEELLKKFNPEYKYLFETNNLEACNLNFSLVRNNAIKQYFFLSSD